MTGRKYGSPSTRGRYVKARQLERYKAADRFAEFFQFMVMLGQVNTISLRSKKGKETRAWIAEYLEPWEDIVYPDRKLDTNNRRNDAAGVTYMQQPAPLERSNADPLPSNSHSKGTP